MCLNHVVCIWVNINIITETGWRCKKICDWVGDNAKISDRFHKTCLTMVYVLTFLNNFDNFYVPVPVLVK